MTESLVDSFNILHAPEWPAQFYDVAMAFGQGPTLDIETKIKTSDFSSDPSLQTEVNTWGRTTAVAMGYLALKKQYREAIWSGGKTGGETFPSEAELMQKTMHDVFGHRVLSKDYDHAESRSTNTLENFVHSLNMMDELGVKSRSFGRMVFVCSDFHASRVKMMATLFNIHDVDVLSSERIVEIMVADPSMNESLLSKAAIALTGSHSSSSRDNIGQWLHARMDPLNVDLQRKKGQYQSFVGGGQSIKDAQKGFTSFEKIGTEYPQTPEGISLTTRMKNEDMFIEGLARIPANWLGFLADIQNDQRLQGIIYNLLEIDRNIFASLKINLAVPFEEVRKQLAPYKRAPLRVFVSLDHSTYDDKETPSMVDKILNQRNRRKQST